MKKLILLTTLTILNTALFGQTYSPAYGYSNYLNLKKGQPSFNLDIDFKQRTSGDIFMTGGIANYRVRKANPKNELLHIQREVWAIRVGDNFYINAYPYSGLLGYNAIEETGYYTFFIGEPARTQDYQVALGITEPDNSKPIGVFGRTGYVILPDGTIKHLNPALLLDLCQDNKDIVSQIESANFQIADVKEMFEILKQYNAYKKGGE